MTDTNISASAAIALEDAAAWHYGNLRAGPGQSIHLAAVKACERLAGLLKAGEYDQALLSALTRLSATYTNLSAVEQSVARSVGLEFRPANADEYLSRIIELAQAETGQA